MSQTPEIKANIACPDDNLTLHPSYDGSYIICANHNPGKTPLCGVQRPLPHYRWCSSAILSVKVPPLAPPQLTTNIDKTNYTTEVGAILTVTCRVFPVKTDPVLVWILYSKDDSTGHSLEADDDRIILYNATKLPNGTDIIISEFQVTVTALMGGASVGCYAYNITKFGNDFSCFQHDVFCVKSLPLIDAGHFGIPPFYFAISFPALIGAGVAMYLLLSPGDEEILPPPEGR
ncbi:hypothetical protein PoB_001699000 [Plakobranchus ocellatus]|uniref:Ig-like domain-containing protein n=1 Tax=Plakobranchus ocellatus TaxID=259542 RepID=A0AAV3Z4V5_9GAST|nr:hypothetical protein PoB_001699000 [Plakobranchus ocellatus]